METKSLVFGAFFFLGLLGCSYNEELREEIFNAQTRILNLESKVQSKDIKATKNHLSVANRSSKLENDLKRINGELGRLEEGIRTGALPGDDDARDTIAARLALISKRLDSFEQRLLSLAHKSERVDQLEKSQIEILSVLETLERRGAGKSRAKLSSIDSVKKAFNRRRYMHIFEDAPTLIARAKGNAAREYRFYYAESLFKLGKLKEAAVSFDNYMKKYPRNRGSKVYLRIGDCLRLLGEKKAARAYYADLIKKFPKTKEVDYAKRYIRRIDKT